VAVGAVVDGDRDDGVLLAQIDLPPRVVAVLVGVGLSAVLPLAALVAVDGPAGGAAVGHRLLRRLALAGDVATVLGNDFDLGERQRLLLAGDLDADVAARDDLALGVAILQI